MKQKKIAMALAAVLVAGSFPVNVSAAAFSDLSDTAWAEETIIQVADKGLINGYEDGTFRGKNNVTYCEAVVMLYNVMTKTNQTADVPDNFYITYQAILNTYKIPMWAQYSTAYALASQSVTPQMLTKFMYNGQSAAASREDVVAMFGRALSEKYDIMVGNGVDFNDAFKISEDALPYVDLMVRLGIISGDDNNNFNPKEAITRAEMAVIMNKTYDLLSNTKGDSGEITSIVNHDGSYYDIDVQMDNGERKKLSLSDDNISVLSQDGSRELPLSSLSKGDKVSIVMTGNVVSKIYLLDDEISGNEKYDASGYLYTWKSNEIKLESENTGEINTYLSEGDTVYYLNGVKSTKTEVQDAIDKQDDKYTYVGLMTRSETNKSETTIYAKAVYVSFQDTYTHTGELSTLSDTNVTYRQTGGGNNKVAKYTNDCEFYIGEEKVTLKEAQALADSGTVYLKITVNKDEEATKIILSEDHFVDAQSNLTYSVKGFTEEKITLYRSGESVSYTFDDIDDINFYEWEKGDWKSCDTKEALHYYDFAENGVYARVNFLNNNEISTIYLARGEYRELAFDEPEETERKGTVASVEDGKLKFKTSSTVYELKSKYDNTELEISGVPTSSLTVFTRMANCPDVTLYAEIVADADNKVTKIEARLTEATGTLVEYDKDEKIIKIAASDGSEFRLETSGNPRTDSDDYTTDDIATSNYIGSTLTLGFDSNGRVNMITVDEMAAGGVKRVKGEASLKDGELKISGESDTFRMDSSTIVKSNSFNYSKYYTIADMLEDDALQMYISASISDTGKVEYMDVTMQEAKGTFQQYEGGIVTLYTENGGRYAFFTIPGTELKKALDVSDLDNLRLWKNKEVELEFNDDGLVEDIIVKD